MSLRDFQTLTLDDLSSPPLATSFLGTLLSRGELFLLLGAGVSRAAGLPNWPMLVGACEKAVGLPDFQPKFAGHVRSSQELMKAMDAVFEKLKNADSATARRRYVGLVRTELYPDQLRADATYPTSAAKDDLLTALGAMVMASARGSIADVFTLNFDDLLEWYLHLHGFSTQVVSDFPAQLRGDRDVTVFHMHGFVPLVKERYEPSDQMVFTYAELIGRISGSAGVAWPTLLSSRLLARRFLAIGTSMQDIDFDVLLDGARRELGEDIPLGVAVDVDISEDHCNHLKRFGVVPVSLASYQQIPDFLLGVCQYAAAERS